MIGCWPPLKPAARTPPPLSPAAVPLAMHWLCFHMALLARRADLSTYDSALIINVYRGRYSPNKRTERNGTERVTPTDDRGRDSEEEIRVSGESNDNEVGVLFGTRTKESLLCAPPKLLMRKCVKAGQAKQRTTCFHGVQESFQSGVQPRGVVAGNRPLMNVMMTKCSLIPKVNK